VYLSACLEAMFRLGAPYQNIVREIVLDLSARYGLEWTQIGLVRIRVALDAHQFVIDGEGIHACAEEEDG